MAKSEATQGAGVRRRGFIGALGAGGLGLASATFGTPTTAFAANAGCCNLAYPPGNSHYVTYTKCANSDYQSYTWTCRNGSKTCTCCEMSVPGAPGYPNYTNSGYKCG